MTGNYEFHAHILILSPFPYCLDSNSSLIHNCQPTLIIWIANLVGVSMNKNHHHFSWARQFHLCCHFLFSECRVREKKTLGELCEKWNFYEYPMCHSLSLSRWIWTKGEKNNKMLNRTNEYCRWHQHSPCKKNKNNSKTAWRTKS